VGWTEVEKKKKKEKKKEARAVSGVGTWKGGADYCIFVLKAQNAIDTMGLQ